MPSLPASLVTRVFALLALAIPCAAACGAAPNGDGASEGVTSTTAEAVTTDASMCPPSAVYGLIAFLPHGAAPSCPTITGSHGEWVSSSEAAPQVCAATRDPFRGVPMFCTYDWTPGPLHLTATPDVSALESVPEVYLAPFGKGGETSCQAASTLPHAALLDRSGVTCPKGPHDPDGPAPCTVCGRFLSPGIAHEMLSVPLSSKLHTVVVSLSNGTERVVTIDTAHARERSLHSPLLDVLLPPPPAGLHYVDGPAPGYGYGHEHP